MPINQTVEMHSNGWASSGRHPCPTQVRSPGPSYQGLLSGTSNRCWCRAMLSDYQSDTSDLLWNCALICGAWYRSRKYRMDAIAFWFKSKVVLEQPCLQRENGQNSLALPDSLQAFCNWCIDRSYLSDNPLKALTAFDTTPQTRRRTMATE